MNLKLMYIANGSLGYFDGGRARAVASQRVDQFARTLRQLEQQHAWKTEGEGAQFMHKTNPYADAAERQRGRVTGLLPYGEGILYAVDLGRTGGLYSKNPLQPDEPEGLITSAVGFSAQDLTAGGDGVYTSLRDGAGSHIARIDPATGNYELLTEGDTCERHPFLSADGETLYFDMRGFARDEQQRIRACSPSAIAALDRASGEIRELYSDADTQYLKYSESADGARRMLVRPYKAGSGSNPLGCLLAPFSAIEGFIRVFSAINAAIKHKEPPMQTSGAEAARRADEPLIIDGVPIDSKRVAREQEKHRDEYSGLLPRDWRLVQIQPDGTLETLQHGVLDYLPLDDGGYLYSNGRHVLRVDANGKRQLLFKEHLVSDLIVMEP